MLMVGRGRRGPPDAMRKPDAGGGARLEAAPTGGGQWTVDSERLTVEHRPPHTVHARPQVTPKKKGRVAPPSARWPRGPVS